MRPPTSTPLLPDFIDSCLLCLDTVGCQRGNGWREGRRKRRGVRREEKGVEELGEGRFWRGKTLASGEKSYRGRKKLGEEGGQIHQRDGETDWTKQGWGRREMVEHRGKEKRPDDVRPRKRWRDPETCMCSRAPVSPDMNPPPLDPGEVHLQQQVPRVQPHCHCSVALLPWPWDHQHHTPLWIPVHTHIPAHCRWADWGQPLGGGAFWPFWGLQKWV